MSDITGSLKGSALPMAQQGLALGEALKRALLGGGLAVAGNLLVYAIARFAAGQALLMPPTPVVPESAPLNVIAVVLASLIPALVAGVVYWLLSKFTRNGRRSFLILSVFIFLLSLAGPLTLPVTFATQLTLNLMHIVAGAAIVGALTR